MIRSTRLQVRRWLATTIVSVALGVGGCTVEDGVGAQHQAATAGSLGGSRTAGGWGNKNLATEGTLDWAHWGLTGVGSFNHKAGIPSQISNFTRLGSSSTLWLNCCADTFSWTGGTPTPSANHVIGGVYVDTPNVSGDGFRITVPADTSTRTLKLYTGYWCARARLQATLSDGSAPPFVDTSADLTNAADTSVYTLDFKAASSGQTLTVDYTIDLNRCTSGDTGEVWLLASTLAGASACTPTTCAAQGKNCGAISDGCGGTLSCGTCTAPQTCGGGGTPNVCGACTPTTCAAQNKNCGAISDGCGGTLNCGTCTAPQTCGGGGTPNVCGSSTGGLTGSRKPGWWNAVSLSSEGTADWAHWGLTGVGSFNHKAGIASQISNFTRLGGSSTLWLNCCAGTFSWTGGTPTTSASNVIGGVYVDTPNVSGDGFRITVPADTSPRTLKLYTGYWCVRARLQATLSDGSAPTFVDTSADLTNAADTSIYTLDFKAAASGQTLTVDYTIDLNRCTSGDTGEVWLLASTLVASPACTPTTCAAQGKNCGSISDGCGGTLDCGSCGANMTCSDNTCSCNAGFRDCDGQASNGCESNVSSCGGVIQLPKTGQTISYAPGDDGALQMGVAWPSPRFIDNGDGTVTDNLTGLMWLKDANCMATMYPSFDQDAHMSFVGDGQVYWQHALDFVRGINAGTYSACGAGHTDWRVPNAKEVRSLVDYSRFTPALPAGHPFVSAVGSWTSSTFAADPIQAWIVSLMSDPSGVFSVTKGSEASVWPVRTGPVASAPARVAQTGQTKCYSAEGLEIPCLGTGQDGELRAGVAWPASRFSFGTGAEAGCATDNLTGLIWTSVPDATTGGWLGALTYANGFSLCGHDDWRLPNVNELESMFNVGQANIASWLVGQGFSVQPGDYWSSTTTVCLICTGTSAWVVGLSGGGVGGAPKGWPAHHWVVR